MKRSKIIFNAFTDAENDEKLLNGICDGRFRFIQTFGCLFSHINSSIIAVLNEASCYKSENEN